MIGWETIVLALSLLSPFRLDAGPYEGAFRFAPGGAVNWYFSNVALLRLAHLPTGETRSYLDAYVAHLDPYYGIADVLPTAIGTYAPIAPDSEDAYAGTVLQLASRYALENDDLLWFKAHADTLKALAYAKILARFKDDGLVRASATDATGYLMDNVEDYDGLRSFTRVLDRIHDPQAAYFRQFVAPFGDAIQGMFDVRAGVYRWSDRDPDVPLTPYPGCAAQMYPQLGAVESRDPRGDRRRFSVARHALGRCHFSLRTDTHESLLYALYVAFQVSPSSSERAAVQAAGTYREENPDIVTVALHAALRNIRVKN